MQPELEADHLPPFSVEVVMDWRKNGTGTSFSPITSRIVTPPMLHNRVL